jgi:hypothetical protein
MVKPVRHRQTKGAATDMFYLTPPRHISTLPTTVFEVLKYDFRITLENGLNADIAACPKRAKELNRRDHEPPKLRG